MSKHCLLFTFTLLLALHANSATITGTVTFEGKAPVMREIDMSVDPVCASKHSTPVRAEILVLGEGQTMANILVSITKGVPDRPYAVPEEPVVLTQEGCRYSPHVFVVRRGQTLKVLNPDGTLHNVHGFAKENREFNVTMMKTIKERSMVFEKAEGPFAFKCQIHPWMNAHCAVLDHPFYDVTAKDGAFKIEGLPPGTYTVEAWHERLGSQTATVTVTAEGESLRQDFSFSMKRR